ncbi:cellulose-binding domain-containing protein [Clostridium gasigenes]|uniref:cellulose binding domain-containing protein n=1 Tax=Clostridium gasigenes TaxID=94869 RepID=UPI001C0AF61C|nr:cellulose binding domain-containing protein [Clostridium gasigenes]MBU3133257.1 cellulose-binding domain-containing protein [Clostridium gasigenes]
MNFSKKLKKLFSTTIALTFIFTLFPYIPAKAAGSDLPGIPTVSHNQWGTDVNGDYDITCNTWSGNVATSYKLYEKFGVANAFTVVSEGKIEATASAGQQVVIPIRGKLKIGMYSYYVEFINLNGASKSSTIQVQVGNDGNAEIIVDTVDNEGIKSQFTIPQGFTEYKLINSTSPTSKFKIISNNTTVAKASIVNGSTLKLEGISKGRSGLKIIDETTGDIRHVGVRVLTSDGKLPGMPDYLSIGQVSEDRVEDLNFWKETSETDTNKRTDVRYVYINGGPLEKGWRTWTQDDGARAKTFITESLKMGMIPFFVYYNIPDDGESYDLDIKHINDKTYMEAYYKDLKFLLDICVEYGGDETVGLLFEPDFLGYMMQQSKKQPTEIAALVDCAYSSGVLVKGKDPQFENSVKGLVESINYTVNKYYPQSYYGWQFNIWSYDSPEIPNQGLLHKTEQIGFDAGREFIKQVATETANYYSAAGVTTYGADFISIDKYGLDGAFEDGAKDNPEKSKWFWNADLWNNYLLYTKTLHDQTKLPVILWQLPVGHINSSQEPNPYNNGKFKDLTNAVGNYEDSAPTYFFGDTFKAGSDTRLNYFSKNTANDPKIKVTGDTVTWGDHMQEAKDAGIVSILFGAGVGASTDAVGSPASDDYWWITKAQRYYKNPLNLDGSNKPTPPAVDLPAKSTLTVDKANSNGNYNLTVNIPTGSKATSYKLYENGATIKTGALTASDQIISQSIINKPTGTYMYKVDLINNSGSTSSNNLTVYVNNNVVPPVEVPLKGLLTVDNINNTGNYKITISAPAFSKATSYRLYENNKIVKIGDIGTLPLNIIESFTNKVSGTYTYRLDLINKDGTTSSDEVKVVVKSSEINPPASGVNVDFSVVQDSDNTANYALAITNNTDKDITSWDLSFNFDKKIISAWDCSFSASNNIYNFKSMPWNGNIPKGKSISFGGSCQGGVGSSTPTSINLKTTN